MLSTPEILLNDTLKSLADAAGKAASQGRWQEAEQLWQRILTHDPRHPQALYSLGVHAFQRRNLPEAARLLQAALAVSPAEPMMLLSLSVVFREQGKREAELQAIDAALAVDPYFLAGLLTKAAHLERFIQPRAAAAVYRNALKVAPREANWPIELRSQLQHAKAQVEKFGSQLAEYLASRLATPMHKLSPFEAQRWQEAGAIVSGRAQSYPSVCNSLLVPRLPAVPFFERGSFAWVDAIEAKTELITQELHAALAQQQHDFKPYIAYDAGTPVNQWRELNHSQRWSSYFLWRNGLPQTEHLAQCPETAKALAAVEMTDIGGLCPNAMFSALAPHTQIPPHHGETNARVIVHLPLVVPQNCHYRVGFEHRSWKVGEVLIFDDSIEHEARNDSDELRVVLIFDVWNPLLSSGERDMVRAMSAATREFNSQNG